MGFRFRKSIGLGPGVRLNLSKSGLGVSVGTRGLRYSVNMAGRTFSSAGIPGTGLSYAKTGSPAPRGGHRQVAGGRVVAPPPALPAPGLLAPKHEKTFAKAVRRYFAGDYVEALTLFRASSSQDGQQQALADDLFAGLISVQLGDAAAAIPYLEKVVQDPRGLPDALMIKYGVGGFFRLAVTPAVAVEAGFDSLGATLALVECYQDVGRREEAIGLLQQLAALDRSPLLVLSLCELYYVSSAFADIVDLAAGTQNQDDAALQIMIYQARALWELGHRDSALEVYRAALRSSKRSPQLLKEARYCRGALYYEMGQKARARSDFARVFADDPHYEQVGEWLRAVSG